MRNRVLFPTTIALGVMLIAGCSDRNEPTAPDFWQAGIAVPPNVPPGPPADAGKPSVGITFVAGGGNMAAGSEATFRVQVTDKKGNPLSGRLVEWSSTNGGGLNPLFGMTDASGYISTTFTAGDIAGTQHVVTAKTSELTASATATVTAATAYSIQENSGNGGSEQVGAVRALSVIIKDMYGNPVPGYDVEFKANAGYGSTSPAIAVTNSDGIATTDWTIGTIAGFQNVEAAAANGSGLQGSPIFFQIEAEPGPPATIEISPPTTDIDGYQDTDLLFTPRVYDAYHNEIDLSGLVFAWTSSNPTLVLVTNTGYASVMQNVCTNTTVTITATTGAATGQAALNLRSVPCE